MPYLWPNNVFIIGPNVTNWNYDQFTDGPAYSPVCRQELTTTGKRPGAGVAPAPAPLD